MMYFAYHANQGRHGLEARWRLQVRAELLANELRDLEAVRATLERDTALLAPDTPDPDMLDEQVRRQLGYARAGDRVLIEDAPSRTAP